MGFQYGEFDEGFEWAGMFEDNMKALLKENWEVTIPGITQAEIEVHKGYVAPEQYHKPQVQIGHFSAVQTPIAGKELEGDVDMTVLLSVKASQDTVEDMEAAKTSRDLMKLEVERILDKCDLPSDWIHTFIVRYSNRDLPNEEPPIAQEELVIRVKYVTP